MVFDETELNKYNRFVIHVICDNSSKKIIFPVNQDIEFVKSTNPRNNNDAYFLSKYQYEVGQFITTASSQSLGKIKYEPNQTKANIDFQVGSDTHGIFCWRFSVEGCNYLTCSSIASCYEQKLSKCKTIILRNGKENITCNIVIQLFE